MLSATEQPVRVRVEVSGVVQGVGLRPFARRLADELGLVGFARNQPGGACIELEGAPERVESFVQALGTHGPPLAHIERIHTTALRPSGEPGFSILQSDAATAGRTHVAPDTATCDACLREIGDPLDRRHRHPFVSCTDCGPRFTVILGLPYDRPLTTMAGFPMCECCAAEYEDPGDRRHHAEPICCPDCGPRLAFRAGSERLEGTDRALAAVHAAWSRGEIVAVKGVGGYHLTCDARSERALATLRERKGRGDKPFALMARELRVAGGLVDVGGPEMRSLTSPARPIVLARRRRDAPVATLVAPGNPWLGVMLPYSALHHLLLTDVPGAPERAPAVIVATSGNRSGEPICTGDEDAAHRLGPLADAFLTHDREITTPCDDSVVRIAGAAGQPVRRSRGYAPMPLTLPVEVAPTLAVGGELKAAFCLAAGRDAWMSPHIGDLEDLETLAAMERSTAVFARLHRVDPELLAADRHPGYLSRRWALEQAGGREVVEVQHHHAHVASLMAEHGLDGSRPLIGVAFDGTGFGPALRGGAAAWGGELLIADYEGFERAGHLSELPLPGGDAAVRNPCRIAVAYLAACGIPLDESLAPVRACEERERLIVRRQALTGAGCVPTTSMGRLFDAVASLLDVRHRVTYEGQAAIELEGLAALARHAPELPLAPDEHGVIDPAPLLAALAAAVSAGVGTPELALGFHHAVARATARAVSRLALRVPPRAGLTGGVFQNELLSRLCRERLHAAGIEVLEHRIVPPGDGGLALGQAVVAGVKAGGVGS